MLNNNYQILTKQMIHNLNLSDSVQTLMFQNVNLDRLNIYDIKQLINNLITIIQNKNVMTLNSRNSYSYSFRNMRKKSFKEIMLLGGLIVFRLRAVLLDEKIIYSLGVTDEKGQLFNRQITQDELFQKMQNGFLALRSSLSSHALVLSKTLEKFNAESNDFIQADNYNLWPLINSLAFDEPFIKTSNPNFSYQKAQKDRNVYKRIKDGKQKRAYYYYSKNGQEAQFFNRGWLYEWYLEYLEQSENHEKKLLTSLQHNSLSPLFEGKTMESIEGYRGGDFQTAMGQQVQAKYHNQQVITFASIYKVLLQIQSILNSYELIMNNTSKMANEFVSLFTSNDSSLNKLNKDYSEIINNQLLIMLQQSQ